MKNAKFVAILLGLLVAGCATSAVNRQVDREYKARYNPGQRVGLWFVDRFNDLTDIVQADVATGQSALLFNVHASKFLELGGGWFNGTKVGLLQRSVGVWHDKRVEYGLGPFYHVDIQRKPIAGVKRLFDHAYDYTGWDLLEKGKWKEADRDWLDIGGSLNVFFIGADVNFSTFEAVDFVLGLNPIGLICTIAGYDRPIWDIMHDDTWYQVKQQMENEQGSLGSSSGHQK